MGNAGKRSKREGISMSKNGFIDNVRVGSPCTEDWNEMRGNSQVRMCVDCVKEVSDLSTFTRKQAKRMVRASDGNICIRYAEHPITKRPIFADQLHQITRRAPGIAAGVMTASMTLSTIAYAQGGSIDGPTRSSNDTTADKIVTAQKFENGKHDAKTKGAESEVLYGTVQGTVTDVQGGIIQNAGVLMINATNGAKYSVNANDEGIYSVESLVPGNYTLESTATVYAKSSITVAVAAEITTIANLTLGIQISELMDLELIEVKAKVESASFVTGGIGFSRDHSTALTRAVDNEDLDEVRDLIARGENVNGTDEEFDTLRRSSSRSRTAILRLRRRCSMPVRK